MKESLSNLMQSYAKHSINVDHNLEQFAEHLHDPDKLLELELYLNQNQLMGTMEDKTKDELRNDLSECKIQLTHLIKMYRKYLIIAAENNKKCHEFKIVIQAMQEIQKKHGNVLDFSSYVSFENSKVNGIQYDNLLIDINEKIKYFDETKSIDTINDKLKKFREILVVNVNVCTKNENKDC